MVVAVKDIIHAINQTYHLNESIDINQWEIIRDLMFLPEIQRTVKYNNDTLITACHCGSLEVIKMIHYLSPEQLVYQDECGSGPLHIACGTHRVLENNISVEVIRFLIQVAPEQLKMPNKAGMLPLHKAILQRRSSVIIKMLLEAYPDALNKVDVRGNTPLQVFYDEWLDQLEDNVDDFERMGASTSSDPEGSDLDIVLETLLLILHSMRIGTDIPMLHQALNFKHIKLPPVFIYLMIKCLKTDVSRIDHNGQYPLHLAVSQEDVCSELIEWLIEANPQAAAHPDRNGKIPLMLAIEHNQSWEVLRELVKAFPGSLHMVDRATGLTPLELNISSREMPICAAYELL